MKNIKCIFLVHYAGLEGHAAGVLRQQCREPCERNPGKPVIHVCAQDKCVYAGTKTGCRPKKEDFQKQHSVNCVPDGLYMPYKIAPELCTKKEVTEIIT